MVEEGATGAVQTRIDDVRGALDATIEPTARSRLRVRLADLLAVTGQPGSAAGQLEQAAAEGPLTVGLRFSVQAVAARLPSAEAHALRALVPSRRALLRASASEPEPQPAVPRAADRPSASVGAGDALGLAASALAPLPRVIREVEPPTALVDQALAALAEGKPARAGQLGEAAARLEGHDESTMARLRDLVVALERSGAERESLRLARTLAESDGDIRLDARARGALAEVVERAAAAGFFELATRWAGDLGRAPAIEARASRPGGEGKSSSSSWSTRFRRAQQGALVATHEGGSPDAALADLVPLLGATAQGAAALALAERLSDRLGDNAGASRMLMLRAAFEGERTPRGRSKLALRLVEALRAAGDHVGAVGVAARAIESLPGESSSDLRRTRADLLRVLGRDDELCRALDSDVPFAVGAQLRELRAEAARLLDRQGEPGKALELRLAALEADPGDLGLLAPARQHLEGIGRLDRSLELASAALPHIEDPGARAALLRDVAALAEAAAGDRARAARAWLEVLALAPGDAIARQEAERLLRQVGDWDGLGALLAWAAARELEPSSRAEALWRLAEFRRVERQSPFLALPLYREISASHPGPGSELGFRPEEWQRRDDLLAVHTARALAAPSAAECARAVADRADLLIAALRLDDADRELDFALNLDRASAEALAALERLYDRRADPRGLRQRLLARVEGASGVELGRLMMGIGRANEALGDAASARASYERAAAADASFRPPLARLRQLASARADFSEAARLLDREIALVATPAERVSLSVELAVLLVTRLDAAVRAVEILDTALALRPDDPAALDAMFGAALAVGAWEKATQALEAMLTAGLAATDASLRYYRVGRAAEKAGQIDRALALYSRSYARNSAFRPTLERLSELCFDRQHWDNAWKATEHLLERHGADLDPRVRAEAALRSALADLHVAQRAEAARRISNMVGGSPSPGGLRDVADSWASMRFEPRLLAGVDGDRKSRVVSRLAEVLALTAHSPGHEARTIARETLAALAVVDGRWNDALAALESLASDAALSPGERCLLLVTAGDILKHQQGDPAGAAVQYQRARVLNPSEARLARAGTGQAADPTLV